MAKKKPQLFDRARSGFGRNVNQSLLQYDRILIVCEGETEANYLRALCKDTGLSLTNIVIYPSAYKKKNKGWGSAPSSLLAFAKQQIDIVEKQELEKFNNAYIVLDKDPGHKSFASTLKEIKGKPIYKGTKIAAIVSCPCFEFWVLLHFTAARMPLHDGEQVLKELKKFDKKYAKDKMKENLYTYLVGKKSTAIKNAAIIRKEADGGYATSDVDKLIEALTKESQKNEKTH